MTKNAPQLRDFVFRGLLFDAECERFREAGLRFGIPSDEAEQDLLLQALAPFSIALRSPALRMARLYATLYCFENSVRELVSSRLMEVSGTGWWEQAVPPKVRQFAEGRRSSATQQSWLEGAPSSPMTFTEFGHLSDIIIANWEAFSDLIPSQHWLKQRFDELEKARNFIAHNRLLLENEFERIEMYVNDWSKQVGF